MFTHLHNHTEYSMLDGISRIPDLVDRTVELGMSALAITDHGSLYGAVDFYSECKDRGIKPIIGCETYVAHESRFNRGAEERSPYHLVLLARDNQGYRNLMQLITLAHLEGFHYRPRVDRQILESHREGLICLSGCASAEVPQLLAEEDMDGARTTAGWYREIFGDGYFLELQQHQDVPKLDVINNGLLTLSRDLNIPLVITNDSHYVRQKDAEFQDLYICIQTNTNQQDEKRLRMKDDSYYIKSPEEMAALFPNFPETPEALENTQRIADMCNVELGFGQTHLPRYQTPSGIDADEYLAKLCWEGFTTRYGTSSPEAEKRMKYELEVIRHTQFANYFLVVWDIIDFARRSGILYGVRGSAAASVALYCLGITDIDPLEYRLVFERFLHLERKEMPDIDMDFQDDRRDEVLHYVIERYGSNNVAQIITFGTMAAKASLRDVGRAMGMSHGDVDRIARMVPLKSRTLEAAMKANQDLSNAYQKEEQVRILVDNAMGLEGIVHHVSTHPAGVLIADEPLADTVPLQRPPKGDENSPVMMTQYSMDPVAKLGLLKMDFLGLTALAILDHTVKLLDETQGIRIDISELPLDDEKTFELLSSGKTTEVFQLESAGMQRYIRELQPSTLGDIAAMIALYRPGPMEHVDTFIGAKHGKIPITNPHDSLKELLDETYGVIVYQDQVLLILQSFAGYSLGEADTVRKAMGKKIPSLMIQEREKFILGAQSQGFDPEIATQIFDLIEPFAGYAFNKAHSVSYALISYWTAYFKTHYPREYMTEALNSRLDHPERVVTTINECFKLKIPVLPPDINHSGALFTIDQDPGDQAPDDQNPDGKTSIRVGLSAVKNVTEIAVRPIVLERQTNGPYESIEDFCRRADVSALNRRALESLIKAGALENLGPRGSMLGQAGQIMSNAQTESKIRNSAQTSLFDAMDSGNQKTMRTVDMTGEDVDPEEKAKWERELIGVSLSHNPLRELAQLDIGDKVTSLDQIEEDLVGKPMTLLGQISSIRERYTKDQKKFITITLDLLGGTIEAVIWPDALERITENPNDWDSGTIVMASGRLRDRSGQYSLHCEEIAEYSASITTGPRKTARKAAIKPPSKSPKKRNTKSPGKTEKTLDNDEEPTLEGIRTAASPLAGVVLRITESEDQPQDASLLRKAVLILLRNPGMEPVYLEIQTLDGPVMMEMPTINTNYSTELTEELQQLLGSDSVSLNGSKTQEPEPAAA